jgi:hypothetical protein
MVSEMDRVVKLLGRKGAGGRAAEAVLQELNLTAKTSRE